MLTRRIGSDGCSLALLLLALATVFVLGGRGGSFVTLYERDGSCRPSCEGITRNNLTVAANLSPEHGFLGFYDRHLNEDGEITYEAYNRFPPGGYLLLRAALLPFPDDLAAQIRAARMLMLAFFAAAAVTAFLSLRRLTPDPAVALAATLLAFSSFYPLFYGDLVATDGSIDLFAVLLTFHGMVVFAQEGRFRQLLAKTCGALLVGWHVYGLLLAFIAFGLAGEWYRGGGSVRSRAARLVRGRHVALGVVALAFGLSVLAFNFAREHHALTRGPGAEVTLAELPSLQSMVRRLGWDADFNEENPGVAWVPLLGRLFQQAGRTSIPWVAEHVARFGPGAPPRSPWVGWRGWTRIALASWGIVVAFCAAAGLAFGRHRVLLAALAASGFCWGVLARGTMVPPHLFEGMFLVGVPLVFFSVVLLRARRVSERSAGVCAGAALLVFVLSVVQMGRFVTEIEVDRSDEFREAVADYARIRAVAPEDALILTGGLHLWTREARYFLPGRIFVYTRNGRQRHRADFVLAPERIPAGAGLLTPDNRRVFLYDRAAYDAQYATLGAPVLEGGRGWRVHLVGERLIYTTGAACGTVGRFRNEPPFFVDVFDSWGRLRRPREYSVFEVAGRCMVEIPLPLHDDFDRIRTGQFVRGAGLLWSAEIPLADLRTASSAAR